MKTYVELSREYKKLRKSRKIKTGIDDVTIKFKPIQVELCWAGDYYLEYDDIEFIYGDIVVKNLDHFGGFQRKFVDKGMMPEIDNVDFHDMIYEELTKKMSKYAADYQAEIGVWIEDVKEYAGANLLHPETVFKSIIEGKTEKYLLVIRVDLLKKEEKELKKRLKDIQQELKGE